jgi:hypothetical protein
MWQSRIEEETVLDGRRQGQKELNCLFLKIPGTLLLGAGDGLHSNPGESEEGGGGTNDSFLRRREQRREAARRQGGKEARRQGGKSARGSGASETWLHLMVNF